ncbi:hypothetical protein [Microbaculum marinisediminis]|uniref:DUF1641 domain-containing protein n=1 Tax=Microbaculum marinisediminis TaxID=2931392 RepID=A0AAW5R5B4_9HYPH|nr:hypothetical protein [Microbaculum sp. A6E488]MCT8973819.1 hypothetical protein [Microbaculum sp. A6E488]
MTDSNNPPADEMARLTLAIREALTDSMVERLAITGGSAFELVDRLNDEQTSEAVHGLLDRLTELHKVGALDTLFELVLLMHAARNASTDNIVERMFMFFEQMINTVGNEAMGTLAENTREALEEAAEEAARKPAKGGMLATVSMLSKPEAQKSLAFLLAFSEKLQQRAANA